MDKQCTCLSNDLLKTNDRQYKDLWKKLGPIEIKLIKKSEACRHKVGEKHYYKNPYARPKNVCSALLHVLDLYTWRVALGFPSWESKDRSVFKIHCPSKNGTVWEMKKFLKKSSLKGSEEERSSIVV